MSRVEPNPDIEIPELGPSLGRLVAPPPRVPSVPALWAELDPIRYQLVTDIFELASRGRVASGLKERRSSLAPGGWIRAWDRAVTAAAENLVQAINARLAQAGREARMPRRRIRKVAVTPMEARAIAARLGAGAGPLLAALESAREIQPTPPGRDALDPEVSETWQRALTAAARRLESAWLELEEAMRREQGVWVQEIERLRQWRRPAWPLWVAGVLIFGLASWLGLALGGYLPVPTWLRPLGDKWWALF